MLWLYLVEEEWQAHFGKAQIVLTKSEKISNVAADLNDAVAVIVAVVVNAAAAVVVVVVVDDFSIKKQS